VNIYIAHYHFEEISSALNALSVHLKPKCDQEVICSTSCLIALKWLTWTGDCLQQII